MGTSTIMVIRHAEKPDSYGAAATAYAGVDATGSFAGAKDGAEHLVTQGWQRAGGLVSLLAPRAPGAAPRPPLVVPQYLFAADPGTLADRHSPSKRPAETLDGVAAALGLAVNTSFAKDDYAAMVTAALACDGPVLICWQHELIPLLQTDGKTPGIAQEILTQTGTPAALAHGWRVPSAWPEGPLWPGGKAEARYDLVFVFQRAGDSGPVAEFSLVGQYLLAGDAAPPA
ncbi:hypothetical protein [Paracraurococcus ruber]|uniref:Histidine phosphatase family protein n=1 Tax=Paracraurococcus ruber TaxID=77675 RepID=A0ABS1CXL1_9PROT|nr:hypothetical protein [Paracraurococcus ruber]MBK1659060.1 hypothetical protein [Paracraurococcus ruber]TDG30041.1 hypothetical protein E2C05_15900 [Paracraurococcus ruber]